MARPYTIAALDIGSSSIKLAVVSKKPGENKFKVLARNQISSLGIRRGVVVDVQKVSEAVSFLVEKTEKESGVKIKSVLASLGGGHIFSTPARGSISVSRADDEISEEDVDRVVQEAKTFSPPANHQVFRVFPREFIVDGKNPVKKAVGMKGVKLEADVSALCVFSPYLRNSTQAVLNSGLEIEDLVPAPLATARAVLTEREKELGVCLLDIGAGTTGMAVFEEENLIHTKVFPVGAGHITNDIAICLKTDIDTAERVKLEFGDCEGSKKSRKKIKVEGGEPLHFSQKELSDIVQARVGEIFGLVSKELKKISREGKLPAGVVLTGGGSEFSGIKEKAKKELKLPCRSGKIREKSFEDDPTLAGLWGLVLEGADLEEEEVSSGLWPAFKNGFKKIFGIFLP